MRGRKPKPLAQRAREGNLGKRALPDPVQMPVSTVEELELLRPAEMPPEAVALWDELAVQLHAAGVISSVDAAALAGLCLQWARAAEARRVIAEEGHYAYGSTGQLVEHPALAIERNALSLFLRFAEQYGLTPAARARIAAARAPLPGTGDPLAGLIDLPPAELE